MCEAVQSQPICRGRRGMDCSTSSDYAEPMTREQAISEAKRKQASDPDGSWIATQQDGEWTVVRIGVMRTKSTGTATKPPPAPPRDDPHSPIERATWLAGGG